MIRFNQHEVTKHEVDIPEFSDEEIKEEKQFFQSSFDYLMDPDVRPTHITYKVLGALSKILDNEQMQHLRFDTKVHMLKPGFYPCIPGWHCDFVKRNDQGKIQPNPDYDGEIRHFIYVSNAPYTQFFDKREVDVDVDTTSWKEVDKWMHDQLDEDLVFNQGNNPQATSTDNDHIYEFRADELHRGVAAQESGWRYFFRASLFPEGDPRRDTDKFANETRTQQQVYIPLHQGW